LLIAPLGRGRQPDGERAKKRERGHGEEAEPDGTTGCAVAVDLGEDVATDVGEGEEKFSGRDAQPTQWSPWNLADLGPDEVRDQEDRDKADRE